jgi:tetratricopeptide (TPR) repeat protein
MRLSRRQWFAALAFLGAVFMGAVGLRWVQNRRFQATIAEVNSDMAAGRYAIAARRLSPLVASSTEPDNAAYLLGLCERGRGRFDDADGAWAKVTPGSAFSPRAVEARLALRIDRGRFADAEQFIDEITSDPLHGRSALRLLLLPIFFAQGRSDDALDLIDARLHDLEALGEGASDTAINLARLYFELEHKIDPVEQTQANLDHASQSAPEDDRIWLGRANLAIRAGKLDQAAHWLETCLRKRPEDQPVWKSRLRWAVASGRQDVVRESLRHLSPQALTTNQCQHLKAWLAREQHDAAAEREALTLALNENPADQTAFDRLVELLNADHADDQLARLREQKAQTDGLTSRYKKLFDRYQPIRDASELGLIAEKLNRRLEARVYLGVASANSLNPSDAERAREHLRKLAPSAGQSANPKCDLIPITNQSPSATQGTGSSG